MKVYVIVLQRLGDALENQSTSLKCVADAGTNEHCLKLSLVEPWALLVHCTFWRMFIFLWLCN